MFWAVSPAVLVQKLEYRDSGEVLLGSKALLLSAPQGPEGQGGQIQAGASCGRNNRLVSGAVLQFSQAGFILRRENWLSTRGVSTPLLYLSRLAVFCGAEQCPLAKTGAQRHSQLPVSATGSGRCSCPRVRESLPSQSRRPCGRLASSPGGRAKCTPVDRGKLCGKTKFFRLFLTTNFAAIDAGTLGSPPRRSCHAAKRHD